MTKPTILFLSRGRRDKMFADTVVHLKDKYNIVVLAEPSNMDTYRKIPGIEVERFYSESEIQDLSRKMSPEELSIIPGIEKELGLNCYEFNINYLLYRKYVDRYGAGHRHEFENMHIPQRICIAYKLLTDLIRKYNFSYCFYETLDTVESYILTAMAEKGIIKQAFEHGIESLGGEIRIRINTGQFRRAHRIEYTLENNLASTQARDWAKQVISKAKQERVASSYDNFYLTQGKVLPDLSFERIHNKLRGVLNGGDTILPAIIRQKNRMMCQKYFSDSLPETKLVSYLMQLTPEASMCSQIPEYADQNYLIEQIAMHGKYGYSVAVKEHPIAYGNRDSRFFRELSLLPNVVLLPPTYPTRDLITRSTAVVVATGTSAGLECITSGTPVIALGNPYFDICKNVYKIQKPQEVWDVIDDVAIDPAAQEDFIASMYAATTKHPEFVSEIQHEIGNGAGPALAQALDEEIRLYEEGKLK